MQSITSLEDMTQDTGYTEISKAGMTGVALLTASRQSFTENDHVWLDVVPFVAEPIRQLLSHTSRCKLTSFLFARDPSESRHKSKGHCASCRSLPLAQGIHHPERKYCLSASHHSQTQTQERPTPPLPGSALPRKQRPPLRASPRPSPDPLANCT